MKGNGEYQNVQFQADTRTLIGVPPESILKLADKFMSTVKISVAARHVSGVAALQDEVKSYAQLGVSEYNADTRAFAFQVASGSKGEMLVLRLWTRGSDKYAGKVDAFFWYGTADFSLMPHLVPIHWTKSSFLSSKSGTRIMEIPRGVTAADLADMTAFLFAPMAGGAYALDARALPAA